MSPMFSKTSKTRVVLVVWVILWMLMVPLFHVHPEADHRHGSANHVHGGIVHSVFSPDLACEHTTRIHDLSCLEADHQHFQASGHVGHALSHPEIEFSLIGSSSSHSVGKPDLAAVGLPEVGSPPVQRVVFAASSRSVVSPIVLFLSIGLPLRAPPSHSI
jgi:hypothetical protein